MDGFRRQLTIKRKVVERNTKDVLSYRKEYSEDARVVQQMEVRRCERFLSLLPDTFGPPVLSLSTKGACFLSPLGENRSPLTLAL